MSNKNIYYLIVLIVTVLLNIYMFSSSLTMTEIFLANTAMIIFGAFKIDQKYLYRLSVLGVILLMFLSLFNYSDSNSWIEYASWIVFVSFFFGLLFEIISLIHKNMLR
jgi:hypothetical protein